MASGSGAKGLKKMVDWGYDKNVGDGRLVTRSEEDSLFERLAFLNESEKLESRSFR